MVNTQTHPVAAPRFVRSANLELDHLDHRALDGYLLTSGARRILGRILPSVTDPVAPRSWTMTGPYGTGKSSFAVFASQLLAPKSAPGTQQARAILKDGDEELFGRLPVFGRQFKGLLPVAITGSREPLQVAILRGLKTTLASTGLSSALARKVGSLLERAEDGSGALDRELADAVLAVAEAAVANDKSGLIIIIDELGKLLEFTAAHPNASDVYVLQHLAELAARSPVPILVVTVLHKDFSGYADRLSAHEKAEWDKVRGRYEDIVFEESADEVLRLVALARIAAADTDGRAFTPNIPAKELRGYEELALQAWRLRLAPSGMAKQEFVTLLKQCWPLHPLVAVLLGPVFRKLSQNERSVFSFVASREPHGLLDYLTSKREASSIYGLSHLYDYLWHSLGEGLYAQRNGKKWAEVESALDRLPDATPSAISVLKMIGVISAIGGTKSIQATPEVIKFGASGVVTTGKVADAIKLLDEASVITTRRYNNTYSLWEGSDVDIDERIRAAQDHENASSTVASLATRFITVRPIVARRHSFETGTLRYFTVEFVEPASLAVEPATPSEADGRVLVVVPSNPEEHALVQKLVTSDAVAAQRRVFVAIPGESRSLDSCLRELAHLEWVRDNTPQLAGDLTARRELRARSAELQRQLDVLASNLLVPASNGAAICEWFHVGRKIPIGSRRVLNDHISSTCSQVFWKTPTVLNELVNRRELSSAAAAARRNLIQYMIERSAQPELGIVGYPPEKSMYLSVLAKHGLHCEGESGWQFGSPKPDADTGMQQVWSAIQSFFDGTEKEPATVEKLFGVLRAEPFGVRDGPLPILLCAALIANDSDVALYEQGTFVPQLAVTVFERLMKTPSGFRLRRWRISGIRATVFRQVADMLGKNWAHAGITKRNVLDVVRPLLRFVSQLPEFTKTTDQISDQAKRVRAALLRATEADQLLFVDLPRACGMEAVDPDAHLSDEKITAFLTELRRSLGELQRHYDTTLGDLGQGIGSAFGIEGPNSVVRDRLAARADTIREWVADPALKNFITRVAEASADERAWIESLSALLAERPPNLWRDTDRGKFDLALTRVARSFRNIEALTLRPTGTGYGHADAIRIGITTRDGGDTEEVVHIALEDREKLDRATTGLMNALAAAGLESRRELALAALAQMARKLLRVPGSGRYDE